MLHKLYIAVASVALFCCVASDVRSQTNGNKLRGIKELNFIIENIDKDASACGIMEDNIQSAATIGFLLKCKNSGGR